MEIKELGQEQIESILFSVEEVVRDDELNGETQD